QFGVEVDGRCDVPAPADHPRVLVDNADVGGGQFLPPKAPRVDEHVGLAVGLPGDVPSHVLGEADVGEVPEGDRHLLFVGEVDSDGRDLGRRPYFQAAAPYFFCGHASTPTRSGPRSFLAAILTRGRLRVVMPRLPLAPVLARSSLRCSLAVVFGWSCLDSRSLRSSLVPRCGPHSRSSSGGHASTPPRSRSPPVPPPRLTSRRLSGGGG